MQKHWIVTQFIIFIISIFLLSLIFIPVIYPPITSIYIEESHRDSVPWEEGAPYFISSDFAIYFDTLTVNSGEKQSFKVQLSLFSLQPKFRVWGDTLNISFKYSLWEELPFTVWYPPLNNDGYRLIDGKHLQNR